MRQLLLPFFIGLFALLASITSLAVTEQCPQVSKIHDLFLQANPLTNDGKMPYPVNITDPEFSEHDGKWFVVTHVAYTKSQGIPFVAFVIFQDQGWVNPGDPASLTAAQALVKARIIAAAATAKSNNNIDYPHFFIGTDPDNTSIKYYFDVCLFAGTINWPHGTPGSAITDIGSGNVVMADLSPGVTEISRFLHVHHYHAVKP